MPGKRIRKPNSNLSIAVYTDSAENGDINSENSFFMFGRRFSGNDENLGAIVNVYHAIQTPWNIF